MQDTLKELKLVAETPERTVVSSYEPKDKHAVQYQTEAELEKALIRQLQEQGYERLNITTETELIANLRNQLERLNDYHFTDTEWDRFFKTCIANDNNGIVEKTRIIQEDYVQLLHRDDGTTKNIYLLVKDTDKEKGGIHHNYLQVINQYTPEGGTYSNRYDVTILVNGLPLVHIELKKRGVSIKEAFNQINRYQRDSFWSGCGLFEFIQIFVISNGTYTKYYSNTTRELHVKELSKAEAKKHQTSNSFEFTSYWADVTNKTIPDLVDFTATFLTKHTLLRILTRYCVFTSEKLLLVMRPYQIAAAEEILLQIEKAKNYRNYGTIDGGGYVWHTTGSGKTLTSFKTARLACELPYIDKVLFVVDRKDLDYQTMKEYDRFEKGAANSNTSTAVLKKQLEDPDCKIIITTIQKLSIFISQNKIHSIYDKHVVLIFDECHRSQFGQMHTDITRAFRKYYLFGFTGTPIFPENCASGQNPRLKTTAQAFGRQLHTYTIVDAIHDENVLPFKIDYIRTMKVRDGVSEELVNDIDRKAALMSKEHIGNVTKYILEHFDQKTMRNSKYYEFSKTTNIGEVASSHNKVEEVKQKIHINGFNSILATESIPAAMLYYTEFKRQMALLPENKRLKVATIYSYGVNEDEPDFGGIIDDENSESTDQLDKPSRDFLEAAIADYNKMFGTSYDTSSDKFQNYYKDVSLRMKNREIDVLIVVNMFLTGFDSTTLNTLWVDKNLRQHGLLQAFSRTNRILNSIKTYGNIVCFRDLEDATDEAIALFGSKENKGIILLKSFDEYYKGYTDENGKAHIGYQDMVMKLMTDYPIGKDLYTREEEKGFVGLYGSILRSINILNTFDQFEGREIFTERDIQDYTSQYIDIHDKMRTKEAGEVVNVNDDIEFEMELVKRVEVSIEYILHLIEKYRGSQNNDKEILIDIRKAVNSSPDLRSKKELIDEFVNQLTPESSVGEDWMKFVREQQKIYLDAIIGEEGLKKEETYEYISGCFKEGFIQDAGTAITKILPPMPLFSPSGARSAKKAVVVEKLKEYFERFYDISSGIFNID